MNIVLTDNCVSDKCSQALALLDCVVVRLPSFVGLSEPVSSHPDMLIYPLQGGELLVTEEYFRAVRPIFEKYGIKARTTEEKLRREYPRDVLFDALGIGDTLYGKKGCVSKALMAEYQNFVAVKQGYTRCSVAMLSGECAVTSDKGIARALENGGIKTLLIRSGYIMLKGYDTGFIGGAGGRLNDSTYCFFGDLLSHPDGGLILEFAAENKITAVSLSDEPLSDHGGMIVL